MPENKPFNLDAAVDQWRQAALRRAGASTVVDELEDHLREDVAALMAAGQGGDEAWRLAISRLGDPVALAGEFAKVDRLAAGDRLALTMLTGLAALAVFGVAVGLAIEGAVIDRPLLSLHIVTIAAGYMAGLLAAAAAAYATVRSVSARERSPAVVRGALRIVRTMSVVAATMTVVGMALAAVWVRSQPGEHALIDVRDVGAGLVAALFLVTAAAVRRETTARRVPLATAIAGGGVILAAWFGVAAHESNYATLPTAIACGGGCGLSAAGGTGNSRGRPRSGLAPGALATSATTRPSRRPTVPSAGSSRRVR